MKLVCILDIVDKIIYGGVQIYMYNVKGGRIMENENVSNQYSTKKNKKNNYRNINDETNKEEKYAIGKENVESNPTNKEEMLGPNKNDVQVEDEEDKKANVDSSFKKEAEATDFSTDSLASSSPATSANVTPVSFWMYILALDLPTPITPPPPALFIMNIRKNQKIRIGTM